MTFIVAEMSLRIECGTKGTKARNVEPQRSSQLHSSDSNMEWDEKISEISFNSTYRKITIQTPIHANTPSYSPQATFLFPNSVTTVPSLKLALVSTHSNFPNSGQTTLQTSHHVPPTTNTVIPTIGYSQYGKLVSPLPPGGRRNGAVSRKLLRKPLAEAREYLASYPRVENTSSFCPTLGFQLSLVTGISYPVTDW